MHSYIIQGDMRDNNGGQCGGSGNRTRDISYNARCYIHYTMAAYPVLTISGSRSYPKTVLAEKI
jgi:hypothetical protein